MMNKKKRGSPLNYKCFWCGYLFQFRPTSFEGTTSQPGIVAKHKGCGSSTVQCPECRGVVPTYSKESTGSMVGRKHVHLTYWNSAKMLFGEKIVPLEK